MAAAAAAAGVFCAGPWVYSTTVTVFGFEDVEFHANLLNRPCLSKRVLSSLPRVATCPLFQERPCARLANGEEGKDLLRSNECGRGPSHQPVIFHGRTYGSMNVTRAAIEIDEQGVYHRFCSVGCLEESPRSTFLRPGGRVCWVGGGCTVDVGSAVGAAGQKYLE